MTRSFIVLCILFSLGARCNAQESQLHADFRGEGERFNKSCTTFNFKALLSCGQVLFLDHPLHITEGNIAPQNGFGLGAAFVTHWTPNERWRLNWDTDAVASTNESWRAGIYMTAIYVPPEKIVVNTGGGTKQKSNLAVREYPVFNLYAQGISLNKVGYFGLGPDTQTNERSFFGMREVIVGTSAIWPVWAKLNLSVYGEANGRFVDLRPSPGQSSPSIEQLYTDTTAPGLTTQPGFAQFGQGIRLRPTFLSDHLRLNYALNLQEYIGAGDAQFSFRRLTVDLSHQIPLYRATRFLFPGDLNGPDDCSQGLDNHTCPSITRNFEGSFELRVFLSEAVLSSGKTMPFFFQPTLGGTDINGNLALGSYQDYRFRAPDALLFSGRFDHSIYGPIGFTFIADEGKVALAQRGIGFSHLAHSYAAGLNLRAGGFPVVWLLFAWGGHEGTHTIGWMDTTLLGGASRPSLF